MKPAGPSRSLGTAAAAAARSEVPALGRAQDCKCSCRQLTECLCTVGHGGCVRATHLRHGARHSEDFDLKGQEDGPHERQGCQRQVGGYPTVHLHATAASRRSPSKIFREGVESGGLVARGPVPQHSAIACGVC